MEKLENENEVISLINNLNIKEELKDKLLYFNEKIVNVINSKCLSNIDIIIDNMNQFDIDILLEYVTKIIEEYGLFQEFIEYKERKNLEDIKNTCVVIRDFYKFQDEILDTWSPVRKFNDFYTDLKVNNNMIIFTCINKLEDYFKDFETKLFDQSLSIHLTGSFKDKDLYERLINKYKEKKINYKLQFTTFKKIINNLDDKKYLKTFDKIDYLYDYSIKKMILTNSNIINNKIFKDLIKEENVNINKIKLEDLTGLTNIKEELDKLYNYIEFNKKIKNTSQIYLNLFFLGNPGTGKTTVARMYSEKLYNLGIIKENKLIEVTANDLMGQYIGHTKKVVRDVLKQAENGVLFIDEAYLLYNNNYSGGNNPYMEEAIVELMKYMENPKNIVIFAGYIEETRNLYNANPGLKSRIYKEIIFSDYNLIELYVILEKEFNKIGLKINSKSKSKIMNYIGNLKNDKNFGNARSMKQLACKMLMEHASKSKSLIIDDKDLPKIEVNQNKLGVDVYDR